MPQYSNACKHVLPPPVLTCIGTSQSDRNFIIVLSKRYCQTLQDKTINIRYQLYAVYGVIVLHLIPML